MKLAIIGDFNPNTKSHLATNDALQHSAANLGIAPNFEWVATNTINSNFDNIVKAYNSFLISPGGLYNDVSAALEIIKYARVNNKPTIGTCGGFQFMVMEYARNVMGVNDAGHAEIDPGAPNLVIKPLYCNIKGSPLEIELTEEASMVSNVYEDKVISERYFCNYGLDPQFQSKINDVGFKIVGSDKSGEARILELQGHDFFVATLFVPQVNSSFDKPNKLITAFMKIAAR